jgi:hypothetical protein
LNGSINYFFSFFYIFGIFCFCHKITVLSFFVLSLRALPYERRHE